MEPKHFRIGNFVNLKHWKNEISLFNEFKITQKQLDEIVNHGNGFTQILTITNDELELEAYGCDLDFYCYDNILPIKCDEYILTNLVSWEFVGFGTRIIYQHTKFKSIKFELGINDVIIYLNDNLISFKKYLHEIQNLFYILTNEELEFNPNM